MRLADWVMDWLDDLAQAGLSDGTPEGRDATLRWLLGELRERLGEARAGGPSLPPEPPVAE